MKNTITITTRIFKTLGFTEEVQQCQCCGRDDLKGTIALESNETGEIVYYGVVCAAKAQGFTKKHTEQVLKQSVKEAIAAAKKEYSNSPEKIAADKFLTDTQEALTIAMRESFEAWRAIVSQRFEIGKPAEEVRKAIAKKYLLNDYQVH